MPRGSAPGEHRGGRAKGTPNKATVEVKALAGQHGPQAIRELARLAGLVEGGKGKADNEQAQIAALNGILEETREQWLARRRRELAGNTAVGAAGATANGCDRS
jgi:hypothetical protein